MDRRTFLKTSLGFAASLTTIDLLENIVGFPCVYDQKVFDDNIQILLVETADGSAMITILDGIRVFYSYDNGATWEETI